MYCAEYNFERCGFAKMELISENADSAAGTIINGGFLLVYIYILTNELVELIKIC
jgi:hypothetical protein